MIGSCVVAAFSATQDAPSAVLSTCCFFVEDLRFSESAEGGIDDCGGT